MDHTIRRILLTRLRFIGDVVLTTPVIRALREKYPESHIAYLGEREAVSLLEGNPHLNEIIGVRLQGASFAEQAGLLRRLFTSRFDLVIDLFSNPRSALMTFATRARVRVGADRRGRGWMYTTRVIDDALPKSAIDFHFLSLKAIGIQPRSYKTEIFLSEVERKWGQRYLIGLGVSFRRPVVAVHPGGTWPAKLWPAERFATLATMLDSQLNATVLLTGGPGDRGVVDAVAAMAKIPTVKLPLLGVRQLTAILSQCSALVSNDCGVMHMAVAVDTPTIGIFGPGEEKIWFPYVPGFPGGSAHHAALRKHVQCHPCHLNVCNRTGDGHMECMRLLGPGDVFEAVKKRV